MGQNLAFFGAVYFVVWWLTLFAVLPWGVKSLDETNSVVPGSEPGAPIHPLLLRKVIITTLVSAVIVGTGYGVWRSGLLDGVIIPQQPLISR